MLFRLLKLAGLDVNAKIAEVRADLAWRFGQASQQATGKARAVALAAGLLLGAGMLLLLALVVGVAALYKWGELHYGVFAGFAIAGGALIALAVILGLVALALIKESKRGPGVWDALAAPSRSPVLADPAPPATPVRAAASVAAASPYTSPRGSTAQAQDLVEPFIVLLDRYLHIPETGYPKLDDVLRQTVARARGTTNEAVERGADLVRHGDRATMLSVLGAATLFGWLLVRAAPRK